MASLHQPTTREIALACGCSQPTVSYALRGSAKIPQATRDKILSVAKKMGWRPNPLAAAYMSHLRSTRNPAYQAGLAFLTSNKHSSRVVDLAAPMVRLFNGAQERAKSLGYAFETIWLHEPHLTAKRLEGVLRSRNISGLIISHMMDPTPILDDFAWENFSTIALGYRLQSPELHRINADTLHGYSLLFQKAAELGYRRVGLAVSKEFDHQTNHGVLNAAYFSQHHLQALEIDIHLFGDETSAAIPGIKTWLKQRQPELVVGGEQVWQSVRQLKWRVPQDVAFMNVDRSPDYPLIAGFDHRHEQHGAIAVDLVVTALMQNERGVPAVPRHTLVKGGWMPSLSAPKKESAKIAKVVVNE